MSQLSRVPRRRFYGEAMQSPMLTFYNEFRHPERSEAALAEQGWTGRSILGMKLPSWQRPEVWSTEQCVEFIESVYLGANIGQFMVNSHLDPALDRVLLDGQQRMRAVLRYWSGEIGLPGERPLVETAEGLVEDPDVEPEAWFWPELTQQEQAHFLRIPFPFLQTQYGNEALMKAAYNRHNFSGTPHRPVEVAPNAADLRSSPPSFVPR